MQKNTKIIIAVVGLGVLTLLLFGSKAKANPTPTPTPAPTPDPTKKCPEGQVSCPDGNGCYDPKANYIVNPCNTSFPPVKFPF